VTVRVSPVGLDWLRGILASATDPAWHRRQITEIAPVARGLWRRPAEAERQGGTRELGTAAGLEERGKMMVNLETFMCFLPGKLAGAFAALRFTSPAFAEIDGRVVQHARARSSYSLRRGRISKAAQCPGGVMRGKATQGIGADSETTGADVGGGLPNMGLAKREKARFVADTKGGLEC